MFIFSALCYFLFAANGLVLHISELAAHCNALRQYSESSLLTHQQVEKQKGMHDLPRRSLCFMPSYRGLFIAGFGAARGVKKV